MRWPPHGSPRLGASSSRSSSTCPTDFDIGTELVLAVAAKLGVPLEDIYIVDGTLLLYRPVITVSIVVLNANCVCTGVAASIPVTLATPSTTT